MARSRSLTLRRTALFVEGTNILTPHGRDDLRDLWRYACSQLTPFPVDQLDVYGFSKLQVVIMDPAHASLPTANRIPLDILIEKTFADRPFESLLVAFDAHPANQALAPTKGGPCLRLEKDFVLERLSQSPRMPDRFRRAADQLLDHYRNNRGQPRATRRPPIGDLELIYMAPSFEALVLQDESPLRALFGLKKTPKTWPQIPPRSNRPDFVLRAIVDEHHRSGPAHLRVRYDAAKHAWAKEILRLASRTSRIWTHEIAQRIHKVVC